MRIHTKIWKKLLNETQTVVEAFVDELRGDLMLERRPFRFILCPGMFPWVREEKIITKGFLGQNLRKVSSFQE